MPESEPQNLLDFVRQTPVLFCWQKYDRFLSSLDYEIIIQIYWPDTINVYWISGEHISG